MNENSLTEIYAKLETALREQISSAEKGHSEIAESAALAQESLDHLIEKVTARRVNAVSLSEETKERLRDLKSALANVGSGVEAQERLEALEHKFAERTDEVNASKDRIVQLEKTVLELEESLEESENLSGELKAANKQVKELKKLLEKNESGEEELQKKIESLRNDVEERSEAVKWSQQRIEELQTEANEATAAAAEAQRKAGTLESALGDKERALEAAGDRTAELEKKLTETTEKAQTLQQDLEALSSDAALVEKLREEITGLESKLRDSDEKGNAACDALEAAKAEVAEIKESLDEIDTLERNVDQIKKLLAAERDRADKLEDQLRRETDTATESALAEQLAQVLKERESQQKELIELRSELEDLRKLESAELELIPTNGPDSTPGRAKGKARKDSKQLMGEILVEAGVISQKQLKTVLDIQRSNPNKLLGTILVEKKYASEDVVAQALALQRNIEFVRLNDDTVEEDALAVIEGKLAELHRCVPIRIEDGKLVLAMVNPLDLVAIEDIERTSGLQVEPVAATGSEIVATIRRKYR